MSKKPRLLLHSCCGPCSTAVVERLKPDYNITLFFYNPNITDQEEYRQRMASQAQFLQCYNRECEDKEDIDLLEGEYDVSRFYQAVRGFEEEAEGGKRCRECILLRLEVTAAEAQKRGYPFFGTTLSVSPHKNHPLITELGTKLAGERGSHFLTDDFKKKDGFQRSIVLSRQYDLYRQNYCGCEFSKRGRIEK